MMVELRDFDNAQLLSGDDKDARCMFCNGLFFMVCFWKEDGEKWIYCSNCFKWGHIHFNFEVHHPRVFKL